eukprot:scaffold62583_cov44-Prasinocladus_malaysianus.AAC.1
MPLSYSFPSTLLSLSVVICTRITEERSYICTAACHTLYTQGKGLSHSRQKNDQRETGVLTRVATLSAPNKVWLPLSEARGPGLPTQRDSLQEACQGDIGSLGTHQGL